MRSSRWALIQPGCGPYKKRQLGHRHRHWEKHVRTRGKMAICKPRREARGESTLPTPWPHLLASGTVRNACPTVGPTGQGCGQGPKTSPTRTFFLDLMSSRCRGLFLLPAVFLASVNSSLSPLLFPTTRLPVLAHWPPRVPPWRHFLSPCAPPRGGLLLNLLSAPDQKNPSWKPAPPPIFGPWASSFSSTSKGIFCLHGCNLKPHVP